MKAASLHCHKSCKQCLPSHKNLYRLWICNFDSKMHDKILVSLTPFLRLQKGFECFWSYWHVFRPNLIDYINILKFLDNEMSRCNGNDSKGWGCAGEGTSVFLWKTFLLSHGLCLLKDWGFFCFVFCCCCCFFWGGVGWGQQLKLINSFSEEDWENIIYILENPVASGKLCLKKIFQEESLFFFQWFQTNFPPTFLYWIESHKTYIFTFK